MVFAGNSITRLALKYKGVSRKGLRQDLIFITLLSLSKKRTSIGNFIKRVWMELPGFKIRAWPFLNSFLPRRPFILLKGVSAMATSSAKITPVLLLIIFIGVFTDIRQSGNLDLEIG